MATRKINLSDFDFPDDPKIPETQNPIEVDVKTPERPAVKTGQHTIAVLCLDISGSMNAKDSESGLSRVELVNQCAKNLINTPVIAPVDKERIDMAVVTFNDNVTVEKDFSPMSEIEDNFMFSASGLTSLYSALVTSIQLARKRKNSMVSDGIECHKPVIFLVTDGAPTDDDYKEMCHKVAEKYFNKSPIMDENGEPVYDSEGNPKRTARMTLVVIGMDQCDMGEMQDISPDVNLIALKNADGIKDAFKLVTASLAVMSQSDVYDDIHVMMDGLKNAGVLKGKSRDLQLS